MSLKDAPTGESPSNGHKASSGNAQSPPGLLKDVVGVVARADLWTFLAWQDIRLRYRRSKIGPLWITLSMGIFVLALGSVYGKLLKSDMTEYLPFISVGFVVWGLIAGLLGEFPNAFVDGASYIKDIKVNPLTILMRVAARHIIILAHNVLIVVGIYFFFEINPGFNALIAIPGLLLVLANLLALGIILSVIGSRYRDLAPITLAVIQILFFVTPLTWFPRLLPKDSYVVVFNPFAYYLDLVRAPILGHVPDADSWFVSIGTLILFLSCAAIIYRSKAARIAFWV